MLHLQVSSMDALDAMPDGSWIGTVRKGRFIPYEKDDGQWWDVTGVLLDPDDLTYGASVLFMPEIEPGQPT